MQWSLFFCTVGSNIILKEILGGRSLLYRLRNTIYRFMADRCGMDRLNLFLLVCYLSVSVLNMIITRLAGSVWFYSVMSVIGLLVFAAIVFRALSRDIYRRQNENLKYLQLKETASQKLSLLKRRFKDRKTNVYRTCPNCRAVLRLPKKRGKHTCVCPKCRFEFSVRV